MAFRNWKQELEDQRLPGPSPWPFLWRAGAAVALLCSTTAAALWVWPGFLRTRPWVRPGPAPERISLVFSGDVHGYLEPCGCTEQRWGGIARAAGLLGGLTDPPARFAFDVGDMLAGPLAWQQLGAGYYLRAAGRMNYTAANVGAAELTLGAAALRRLAHGSPVPLVSANVIDPATGRPVVRSHHQVLAHNLRLCATGVVELAAGDRIGEGLVVVGADEALGALLPKLRPQADVIVLLAACDRNRLRELARAHPEIDVVLGGRVRQASPQIERVGNCWIAYQANKGQMLGRVDVRIRRDGRCDSAESRMLLLDNDVPEDEEMLRLVREYNAELERLNRDGGLAALGITVTPRPGGPNTYVGPASCLKCHPSACAAWAKSDHSRAYASLVRRRRAGNPDCVRCHVVDFAAGDGFRGIAATPERIHVQCECCHGRSSVHVAARLKELPDDIGKLPPVQHASCESCHDCVHSPQFSFETYWEKMKHGNEPEHP